MHENTFLQRDTLAQGPIFAQAENFARVTVLYSWIFFFFLILIIKHFCLFLLSLLPLGPNPYLLSVAFVLFFIEMFLFTLIILFMINLITFLLSLLPLIRTLGRIIFWFFFNLYFCCFFVIFFLFFFTLLQNLPFGQNCHSFIIDSLYKVLTHAKLTLGAKVSSCNFVPSTNFQL